MPRNVIILLSIASVLASLLNGCACEGLIGSQGNPGRTPAVDPSAEASIWLDFFDPPPPLAPGEHINCYSGSGTPGSYLLSTNTGITDRILRLEGKTWSEVYRGPGDILRTAGTAVFLFKRGAGKDDFIQVSKDGGLHWTEKYPAPPKLTAGLLSGAVDVISPNIIVWASVDAVYKTSNNGLTWSEERCPIGTITSLAVFKAAGTNPANNDLLVVGIDSTGKVRAAREKTGLTNWQIIDIPVPFTSTASSAVGAMQLGYPTRDGVIVTAQTRDGNPGVWVCEWGGSKWTRVDYGNPVGQGLGISNGQGTPGTAEEGSGIIYICDSDSIVRVRGYGDLSERISLPGSLKDSKIIWLAPTFTEAGPQANSPNYINIGLDTDGDNKIEKILNYRDYLNTNVTGATASKIAASSAVVNWNALAGAMNYTVFVSTSKQVNYYTAENDPGILVKYNLGDTIAWVSGLSPASYWVTVWAISPVTSFYCSTTLTIS